MNVFLPKATVMDKIIIDSKRMNSSLIQSKIYTKYEQISEKINKIH